MLLRNFSQCSGFMTCPVPLRPVVNFDMFCIMLILSCIYRSYNRCPVISGMTGPGHARCGTTGLLLLTIIDFTVQHFFSLAFFYSLILYALHPDIIQTPSSSRAGSTRSHTDKFTVVSHPRPCL